MRVGRGGRSGGGESVAPVDRIAGGERVGAGSRIGEGGHGTEPPPAGKIRPFSFPEVVSGALDNGLQTRVARLPRIPMATATVVLNAGESWLSDDRAGLAVVTGDCLDGGTEKRSGADLAEALEGLGADLSVATGWDSTTVSLSCHADRLSEGFALLAEVIREPAFPEGEVARVRNQQLATLAQRKVVPSKLAVDHALRGIYAEGIPYGRPIDGVGGAVEGIGAESTKTFVDEAYRPGDGGLVVAGDVDEDEVLGLARDHLGGWSGEARGRPESDVEPRVRERRIVVVDRPGSVQSELRMGHVGIRRTSEDYFPLRVFNTLLGGTFTSRLNQRLRDERGFTYGVRSRFSTRRLPGPFMVST
ncbi:MAG: M16 family metallopeptidase, partial [Gemmatimonadota bacterium]